MTRETGRKYVLDVVLVGVSQLLAGLKRFLALPLIVRALPVRDYGIWSQTLATANLATPLAMLRLDSACIRYLSGEEEIERVRRGFFSSLGLIVFDLLVLLALLSLMPERVSTAVFGPEVPAVYAFLLWLKLASAAIFEFLLSFFRLRQQNRTYSLLFLINEIVGLALVVLLLLGFGSDLVPVLLALSLAELALGGAMATFVARRIGFRLVPDWSLLALLLRLAIPLLPYMGVAWAIHYVDRFVILHHLGIEPVAVYSAAYMIANLAHFVKVPINTVLLPLLSAHWARGETATVRRLTEQTLLHYCMVSVPCLLVVVVGGAWLLPWLTGSEDFRVPAVLILAIAVGVLLSGLDQLFRNILILHERTAWLFPALLPLAVLNLLLSLWWVPELGILGAALSTLVVMTLKAVVLYLLMRRLFVITVPWRELTKILAAAGLMALLLTTAAATLAEPVQMALGLVGYTALLWLFQVVGPAERSFLIDLLRRREGSDDAGEPPSA